VNRRQFIKGAAIAPAAVAASQWSAAAEALGAKPSRITAVVYDERYADCRIFAETLARQGAVAFSTGEDAASLWYGPLRAHLGRYDGGVAGMTTDCDLAVSRGCGRELSMQIAYEGSHDGRSAGCLKHRLRGTGEEREVYTALLRAEGSWAQSIADALARPPLVERIVHAVAGVPTITTPQSAEYPGYLTSWLLSGSRRNGTD